MISNYREYMTLQVKVFDMSKAADVNLLNEILNTGLLGAFLIDVVHTETAGKYLLVWWRKSAVAQG